MLAWGLLITVTACAPVGPDYQGAPTNLPTRWHEESAAQIFSADTETAELEAWWTLFRDPILNELITRATLANHDLQIATSRTLQARAEYGITRGEGGPQVELGGAYTNSGRSSNVSGSTGRTQNLYQSGFDAAWELDLFGGNRRAIEGAQARLDAAQEDRRAVLISLQAEVARNYFEVRGSQQRLIRAEQNLATAQKSVELAHGRQLSGFGNQLDVAQAETALELLRADLPALQRDLGGANYRLCTLLGLPAGALNDNFSPPQALAEPPTRLPAILPSDLLRRRPDIRRAERQLAAATADVGVAVAGLFPRFSLTGLLGLQSSTLGDLLSSNSRYWSAGPAISWSLFNHGRLRANVDLNRARREEAQGLYEKSVLTALAEVESSLLSLHRETESYQALTVASNSAQEAFTLATGRYRAGLSGMLEVLISERALYQAEDRQILSAQRRNTDLVALFKALGGGWQMSAAPESAQNDPTGESRP